MKRNYLSKPLAEEKGQAMVEYILITALLIAVSYGAVRLFAHAWHAKFDLIKTCRSGQVGIGP